MKMIKIIISLFLNILFSFYLHAESFDYSVPLFPENSQQFDKLIFESKGNFDYKRQIIKKINVLDAFEKDSSKVGEENVKIDNQTIKIKNFSLRILISNPLTIVVVYKPWGISLGINDIMHENFYVDNDKTEIKETKREAALSLGYVYFLDKLSLGLGLSNYKGDGYKISSSIDYSSDSSSIGPYMVLQLYFGYDFSENYEVVAGFHQTRLKYRGIEGNCNPTCQESLKSLYVDRNYFNIGIGYKF